VLGVRLVARERLPRVVLAHEGGVPVPLDARAVGIDAQRAQARDGTHEWLEGLAQGAHAGGPGGLVTLEGEQDDVANHETPPRMSDQFRPYCSAARYIAVLAAVGRLAVRGSMAAHLQATARPMATCAGRGGMP